MRSKQLIPNRNGTLAEKAAFDLVWYFKVVLSEDRPAYFSDENVLVIVGIVQNIIDAAAEDARYKIREIVRECMGDITDPFNRGP